MCPSAYSGTLLFEWAVFRGFELTPREKVQLAKAHAEVWLARGLAAERFHLEQAKRLFDEALTGSEEMADDSR